METLKSVFCFFSEGTLEKHKLGIFVTRVLPHGGFLPPNLCRKQKSGMMFVDDGK